MRKNIPYPFIPDNVTENAYFIKEKFVDDNGNKVENYSNTEFLIDCSQSISQFVMTKSQALLKTKDGLTALHYLTYNARCANDMGKLGTADSLLNYGADVNALCIISNTSTSSGSFLFCRRDFPASLSNRPSILISPLCAALASRLYEVAFLLLKRGADINKFAYYLDGDVYKPISILKFAIETRNPELLDYLLKHKVNIHEPFEDGTNALEIARAAQKNEHRKFDDPKDTPSSYIVTELEKASNSYYYSFCIAFNKSKSFAKEHRACIFVMTVAAAGLYYKYYKGDISINPNVLNKMLDTCKERIASSLGL